jgi:deoxyribose-phosphate aldolase
MSNATDLSTRIAATTARVLAELATSSPDAIEPVPLTAGEAAALIDHTLLKPDAVEAQIRQLCRDADAFGFASVCVNPTWVPLCAELLEKSAPKVCAVVGFPLGAMRTPAKAFEALEVIAAGAEEIDMVINVGLLRDGRFDEVRDDVAAVVDACHESDVILKVIIEAGLLTDEEKVAACLLCQDADADFVKTSTGFNAGGATVWDVALMRAAVGPEMGVKAAGGVGNAADAGRMVAAGATRIGASAGVQIVRELLGDAPDAAAGQGY